MIHLPASVRVYLCLTACDMRKSFDGLHALVREHLELDAFAGHLFVFASRRKDQTRFCIPIGLRCCRVPLASPIRQKAASVSTNSARWCRGSSCGSERNCVAGVASVDGRRLNL
jgi:IS66 Orf2 like protein